jgi:DNA topoisomerase-3
LFDLTALQVEANKKFAYTADDTMKGIQNLYEKKLVTYPRVDTTYLSEDIYPKVPGILEGMKNYEGLIAPLLQKPIPKSKVVFDDKKVTDHHAIIPTGVAPSGISPDEQRVYDLIVRRFIAVFYPECKVSNTTVMGKVVALEFKATGKQVLDKGWRVLYDDLKAQQTNPEDKILPLFAKGESGPHAPFIHEGKTSPPKYYTEATLLRAMETAGKLVENEEMREVMKENGIGRPSTRASIIETLFKRQYVEKKKKNLIATPTGMSLIDKISFEMLKSPELTGQWEHKLRMIERGTYEAQTFKDELFVMVRQLTDEVIFGKK